MHLKEYAMHMVLLVANTVQDLPSQTRYRGSTSIYIYRFLISSVALFRLRSS